jgi:predicted aspartyl protease
MRKLAALIAFGLLTAPVVAQSQETKTQSGQRVELPTAELDDTLAIGGEEIEGKKLRRRMTVEVDVNGVGPYKFIVDSGADTSVVGAKLAEELALPAGDAIMLGGITEVAMVDRVLVDSLRLGPTTVTDLELPVLRDGNIGAEGMIGLDALIEQRLVLDFEDRTISVDDAATPRRRNSNEIVVRARLQRGQLILAKVKANGVPLDAVIDTGTEITIGNLLLRERLIRRNQKFQSLTVVGVTGKSTDLQLAFVRELRLGPIILRNVPIAFADVPPFEVFGIADKPALLLGTDLMETFRKVSLDFGERKLRFQLKKCNIQARRIRTVARRATRIGTDNPDGLACKD